MAARVASIDSLFSQMSPDPDRPPELGPGEAEMDLAVFTDDGPLETGVWACGVGAWNEVDTGTAEAMVVLEGHVRIEGSDGVTVEARAGDLLHIPAGWSGRWVVLEPMRKIWVIPGES